jgi:hypothetical protein
MSAWNDVLDFIIEVSDQIDPASPKYDPKGVWHA